MLTLMLTVPLRMCSVFVGEQMKERRNERREQREEFAKNEKTFLKMFAIVFAVMIVVGLIAFVVMQFAPDTDTSVQTEESMDYDYETWDIDDTEYE